MAKIEEKELEEFRRLLQELRKKLANNVTNLQNEALGAPGEKSSELADVPLTHLADRASDTFAQDMMVGILQDSEAELADVDNALEKIDRGIYGTCENCRADISRARLKALPFARLCIDCKREEESASM